MDRAVCLFHTGDDPGDHDFARRVAELIRPFCSPLLINVDELERMDDRGAPRPQRFRGVPVYVLSTAMLHLTHHRRKLVTGTPGRNLPGRSVFYICHGVTTAEIRARYPDLQKLFLDVMVGEEADLPAMVDELKAYIERAPDRVGLPARVWLLAQFLAGIVMSLFGTVGYCAYLAAFPSALWLLLSLLLTGGRPDLETAAACHVLFGAGYGINRVRPLDLWPWLGPAWGIGAQPPGGHRDSGRTLDSFLRAIGPWQQMVEAARMLKVGALCWLVIPGVSVLIGTESAWAGAAAFVVGLGMPRLWSVALRYLTRRRYWTSGMSDDEMERTAQVFSPWGFKTTPEFDYRHGGTRGWQLVYRPWLRKPPKVFISYAWRDEDRTPVARTLHQTISRLGVPCFLDTRRIPGKFSSWRARVVDEILDCTHLFVVLGPNVHEAQVVHREIRTALQRWYTELEPAVACVVEPEVGAALSAERLSPELRYLLHEAPKMTYAEAARGEVVARLLLQRRRQALWQDWLALLQPAARLRRFLKMESVGGHEIPS